MGKMVILKVIRHTDGGEEYIRNVCNYVIDKRGQYLGFNGICACDSNPYDSPNMHYQWHANMAADQIIAIQKYFGKFGKNPLFHFVISFPRGYRWADAIDATKHIAYYFKEEYQYFYTIHVKNDKRFEDVRYYHAHLIVNPVSYMDGKMYKGRRADIFEFARHIEKCTENRVSVKFIENQDINESYNRVNKQC